MPPSRLGHLHSALVIPAFLLLGAVVRIAGIVVLDPLEVRLLPLATTGIQQDAVFWVPDLLLAFALGTGIGSIRRRFSKLSLASLIVGYCSIQVAIVVVATYGSSDIGPYVKLAVGNFAVTGSLLTGLSITIMCNRRRPRAGFDVVVRRNESPKPEKR